MVAPDTPAGWTEDPIRFEVLRHAFISIVDEMSLVIERVAHSLVVSEGRDFSTAICTSVGDLVAEGKVDQPSHVATLPATARGTLNWIGLDNMRPGDVFIMNDPFIGGSHCQDVRTLKPVFWDGELVALVVNSAHWSDAGGPIPGSFNAEAADAYGEALHISPIHIVREGELDSEVLRFILRNIRVPELTQGDIMGQLAALNIGEKRLHELLEKCGRDVVLNQMADLITYSEKLLRAEFERIPDGDYSFTDYVDFDPLGDRSVPVPVSLTVRIRGDRATFDFSGTAPQARGAINSPRSMTQSACAVTMKAIYPHLPQNEGVLRPIELQIPEASVLDARFPASVNGTFATTYEKVVGAVFGCFLQVVPERCMTGSGNISNLVVGGFDPRPGYERDYVLYVWRESGYGARPGKKDNHTAMSLYSSGTRNEPVELMERIFPVRTVRYSFITDSAGAGLHRGGLGVSRDFKLTHGGGTLSVMGDRAVIPAWGYADGLPAIPSGLMYGRDTTHERDIGVMTSNIPVDQEVEVAFTAGGGGGWGDPKKRPIEWVLDDVIDEVVSVNAACDLYGVAVIADDSLPYGYRLDKAETARLRGSGAL